MNTQIFPGEIANAVRQDPARRAEMKVYDAFVRDTASGAWRIFYSVGWLARRSHSGGARMDGETDFIAVHPKYGVLLIEVKGGRIQYDAHRQTWTSTDSHSVTHDIDPLRQLRDAKYALLEKLRSVPALSRLWVPMGHGVLFPDSVVAGNALPLDTPRAIVIDGSELAHIYNRLDEVAAYFQDEHRPVAPGDGNKIVDAVTDLLAPRVRMTNPLSLHLPAEEREIYRLTNEQFRLLDFLNRHRRAAICGCAGSGKTMMAVEKADRLGREGFRTLLVCCRQTLADYLKPKLAHQPSVTVASLQDLATFCEREVGVSSASPAEAVADRLVRAADAPAAPRWDAILADEGQDFTEGEWVALLSLLEARDDSLLYIFYDNNQKLYPDVAQNLPIQEEPYILRQNVRNTQAIHRQIRPYYSSETLPYGPSGRDVETVPAESDAEMQTALSKALRRLISTERVPAEDIVVLTPRAVSGEPGALEGVTIEKTIRLREHPDPARPNDVRVASIPDFKGLEAPVVIVTQLDASLVTNPQKEALCYVALSRARLHLILIGDTEVLRHILKADIENGR